MVAGSNKNIWWKCSEGHEWKAIINNRTRRTSNCPYCGNKILLKGYNDLQTKLPELAKEWHPTKNGKLQPNDIVFSSTKKVWWKCTKGHEWEASPKSRNKNRNGKQSECSYCNNTWVLKGYNDLASQRPEVAKYWDYDKNDCLPSEVFYLSRKKAYFKCECGHEWNGFILNKNICSKCNK